MAFEVSSLNDHLRGQPWAKPAGGSPQTGEMTQERVAERSGVHATEVSRIEAGKRDPRVSTVERLAYAVNLRPGQLLE